jgi:hypothetical protein
VIGSWLAGPGPQNIRLAQETIGRPTVKEPVMRFVIFDREATVAAAADESTLVRVQRGRLLFNRAACAFLREQYGAGPHPEVALLFCAESRMVGVRPLGEGEAKELSAGTRWPLAGQRSLEWPLAVAGAEFVDHYQVAEGEYLMTGIRGPGPRMLTFLAPKEPSLKRRRALAETGGGR